MRATRSACNYMYSVSCLWAKQYVTRGRGTAPSDTIQGGGGETRMRLIFAAVFTGNTEQTTLEGGEGISGDDERTDKKVITFQKTMTIKVVNFLRGK